MAVYCKRCLNPVRLAVPDAFSEVEAVCIDNHNTRILCIYTDRQTVTVFIATTCVS